MNAFGERDVVPLTSAVASDTLNRALGLDEQRAAEVERIHTLASRLRIVPFHTHANAVDEVQDVRETCEGDEPLELWCLHEIPKAPPGPPSRPAFLQVDGCGIVFRGLSTFVWLRTLA